MRPYAWVNKPAQAPGAGILESLTHCCRCDDAFQVLQVLRVHLPSHHDLWATKVVVEAALGDVWHWLLWVVELNLLQERGGDLVVEFLRWEETEKWVCCTQSKPPKCAIPTERRAGDETGSIGGHLFSACNLTTVTITINLHWLLGWSALGYCVRHIVTSHLILAQN